MNINAEGLWHYSLRFYDIPLHKEALLWLQDAAHLNVNIVLAYFYAASNEWLLKESDYSLLYAEITVLDKQTSELRKERKAFKESMALETSAMSLNADAGQSKYKQMLTHELALEKQQQSLIADWLINNLPQPLAVDNFDSNMLSALLIRMIQAHQDVTLDCPAFDIVCAKQYVAVLVSGFYALSEGQYDEN